MNSNDQQLLLDELKQLFSNFTCTLQDLRNPTEEFVTSFYTFWLSEFEVNIATIPQTQFSQQTTSVITYHDSYSSTIPKLNLLLAIRSFNVVPDFGMLDIVSPTPRRILTVIRAFCDFYQWCDLRIGSMMDMKKKKKISERKQQLANMVQEKENLQEELNNIFKTIGQLQDTKKELEGEVLNYKQLASELRVGKEMLKNQSDEANEKIKEKEAVLHRIIKEDSQVANKMKDYSNQIVTSPTMILSDLETLRVKEEEIKNLSEQKRDTVESKMQAQSTLEKVLGSVEEKSVQLDEVLKVIEHQRKLLQIVTDIEKNTVGCQEELKELKSSLMSVKHKKSSRQEELQALNLKWKTMKDQLTQSLEAAISEMNSQKSAKSKMIVGLKEDAAVEEKIASVVEKIKVHVKAFEDEYERIKTQQNACFERIRAEGISQMEQVKLEAEKRNKKTKSRK